MKRNASLNIFDLWRSLEGSPMTCTQAAALINYPYNQVWNALKMLEGWKLVEKIEKVYHFRNEEIGGANNG